MTTTTTTMKAITISPTQTPFLRHHHNLSLLSFSKPSKFLCNSSPTTSNNIKIPQQQQQQHKKVAVVKDNDDVSFDKFEVQVGNNGLPATRLSLSTSSDQASFLLTFIACSVTASFVGFVMAAVPTLFYTYEFAAI
ncbi:hypothetical protein Tco_0436615 [Tanacetum coccineum]